MKLVNIIAKPELSSHFINPEGSHLSIDEHLEMLETYSGLFIFDDYREAGSPFIAKLSQIQSSYQEAPVEEWFFIPSLDPKTYLTSTNDVYTAHIISDGVLGLKN
jgi:hypothetical protein